jgi:ribonuclease HI
MQAIGPHYLLFTDSVGRSCQARGWRFVLQPTGEGERIVAADVEQGADDMRLDLLAVVRGLEALEQPSHVTLLAANRFVRRGIRHGLCQWRDHDWRWERFGKLVPIRDQDLWQRVDRALGIHQVECLVWHASEHEIRTGRFSGGSLIDHYPPISTCDEPVVVIVPRRDAHRTYPPRRQGVPASRRRTHWGQEVLKQLAGWGQPALSRTA